MLKIIQVRSHFKVFVTKSYKIFYFIGSTIVASGNAPVVNATLVVKTNSQISLSKLRGAKLCSAGKSFDFYSISFLH